MRQTAVTAALILFATAALAQGLSVVQADYIARTVIDGEVTRQEEGTYLFAPDGRRRLDRVVNGERTAELVLPATREQIDINFNLGVAVRGPAGVAMPLFPRLEGLVFTPSSPPPPEVLAGAERAVSAPLGEQARGPLLLRGSRTELPGRVNESWVYFEAGPEGALPPLELESIERYTTNDGHEIVVEKRLVGTPRRVAVDLSMFDVPEGIDVRPYRP